MRKKNVVFISIYKELTTNNFLFLNAQGSIGDKLFLPTVRLKESFADTNINLCTPDKVDIEDIDLFVFCDMPQPNDKYLVFAKENNIPRYLGIAELTLIHTANANMARHDEFDKIFTYQDNLIDNKKYFKLNYSFEFPSSIPKDLSVKEKLCTLIAANKTLNHPLELYSKRVEAIRWFEAHHPGDFDLYGINWDKPVFFHGSRFKRIFNRFENIRKHLTRPFASYKGKVSSKHDTLKKYRFCICYENAKNIPGFITEKIFDCLIAGCVPVYWGANNISEHIPPDCFIDKRKFESYEQLYEYMHSMSDSEYKTYLQNIESFISGDKVYEYSIDYYINTLKTQIIKDIGTV